MSEDKTGGPAFPLPYECYTDKVVPGNTELFGMSLRDYFAASAMQGLLASPNATGSWLEKHSAKSAYLIADMMLEARK